VSSQISGGNSDEKMELMVSYLRVVLVRVTLGVASLARTQGLDLERLDRSTTPPLLTTHFLGTMTRPHNRSQSIPEGALDL